MSDFLIKQKKNLVRNVPLIVSLFGPMRTHMHVVGSYSERVNQIGPSELNLGEVYQEIEA